ncbi:Translation initiation factor IF3-1 mitochondrial [Bienertia sinuspersici]
MALISKIKEFKPNYIIHHIKRHYFQIPAHRFVNQTTSQRLPANYFLTNTPTIRTIFKSNEDLFNFRVRFFAAPVQIKKKEEAINPSRPRLNDEIKVDVIRLVDGDEHTILSRHEALDHAKQLKLDLVEVDRNAKPPVCKIMDYNREKYKKQVKEKERAKIKSAGSLKRGDCKEVRFSAKTELKDLKMKADAVKRLMERGYRVKCSATGSEDQDLVGLLTQLATMIEDVVFVESGPKMGKDQAYLIVRHIKFGPSKKGGKKSSKDNTSATPEIRNAATASSDNHADLGEESDYEESGSSQDKPMFDREVAGSATHTSASRFSPTKTPNFTDPNVQPVSQESENRYARNAANSASAVRNPMRLPTNGSPPQPHPQFRASVPPPRVPQQNRGEVSPPKNFRLPSDEIQNQSSQPNSNFSGSIRHHQPPSNASNVRTHPPGFGTFSSTKLDANNPSSPFPSNVTRSPIPTKVADSSNSSTSKADAPQNPESTEKKFGIFSK